jgi:hypothetical protein
LNEDAVDLREDNRFSFASTSASTVNRGYELLQRFITLKREQPEKHEEIAECLQSLKRNHPEKYYACLSKTLQEIEDLTTPIEPTANKHDEFDQATIQRNHLEFWKKKPDFESLQEKGLKEHQASQHVEFD